MAKLMTADTVYRAVITTTYHADPDSRFEIERRESVRTDYVGPFGTSSQAEAAIRLAKQRGGLGFRFRRETTVEGHVETAQPRWTRVGAAGICATANKQ